MVGYVSQFSPCLLLLWILSFPSSLGYICVSNGNLLSDEISSLSTTSLGSGTSSKSSKVKDGWRSSSGWGILKLMGAFLANSVSSSLSSRAGIEKDMGEFSARSGGARSSEG